MEKRYLRSFYLYDSLSTGQSCQLQSFFSKSQITCTPKIYNINESYCVEGGMGAGAGENMRQKGYERREKKDKKEREAGSQRGLEAREKFKKESVCYFLLLMIHSKT